MKTFHSIKWIETGIVRMLDQRLLPHQVKYNDYTDYHEVARAIQNMVIRGAPAIGAAAAYGLVLVPYHTRHDTVSSLIAEMEHAADVLGKARPTAVNLSWAINRMMGHVKESNFKQVEELKNTLLHGAHAIVTEDIAINKQIGNNAMSLVPDGATIIHHCNTGSLATVEYGTALGIIRMAHEEGKGIFALVDETRPRLQGARLTSWELLQYGVPFQVIADGASGHFMRTMKVDLCFVGADRVAANGDTANKIGTYNLAVVAHENRVPFYVAVPTSTIDMKTPSGEHIVIEERPSREVTHVGTLQITPDGTPVGNPAFDITPARYVTAFITEKGVIYPPFGDHLNSLFKGKV